MSSSDARRASSAPALLEGVGVSSVGRANRCGTAHCGRGSRRRDHGHLFASSSHRHATKLEHGEQKRRSNALRPERAKSLPRTELEDTHFCMKVRDEHMCRCGADATLPKPACVGMAMSMLEIKQTMCRLVAADTAFVGPELFHKPARVGAHESPSFKHSVPNLAPHARCGHEALQPAHVRDVDCGLR